jgi:DNA-directed RNA polymerase subunit K/omega
MKKKFYDLWQKLDDLTKKASEEIAKKLVSTEPREELVSLEDVGLDAPNVRRRGDVL